jgi:hypothetical protein
LTKGWIAKRIEKASWTGFLIWFVIWFAYNWWTSDRDDAIYYRLLEIAGGKLPESQPGLPAIEPQRSFDALAANNATNDYLLWQLYDIPYVLLFLVLMTGAMALCLKTLRLVESPLRRLMWLPVVFIGAEFVENPLLAGFALGVLPLSEPLVLFQQTVTTVKFAAGVPAMLLALVSLAVALVAQAIRLVRRRGKPDG